jgi:hypothetical protein
MAMRTIDQQQMNNIEVTAKNYEHANQQLQLEK